MSTIEWYVSQYGRLDIQRAVAFQTGIYLLTLYSTLESIESVKSIVGHTVCNLQPQDRGQEN